MALEAGEFGLIEVERHDVLDKFLRFVHNKASSVRLKADNVAHAVVFDPVEHHMEFDRKWEGNSAPRSFAFAAGAAFVVVGEWRLVGVIDVLMLDPEPHFMEKCSLGLEKVGVG